MIKSVAVLVKSTGWKLEYILWEVPLSWVLLLIENWPGLDDKKDDDAPVKDIAAMNKNQLKDLGLGYVKK